MRGQRLGLVEGDDAHSTGFEKLVQPISSIGSEPCFDHDPGSRRVAAETTGSGWLAIASMNAPLSGSSLRIARRAEVSITIV